MFAAQALPTSMASASRLNTSTTVSARNFWPLLNWSWIKSSVHASFGRFGWQRASRCTTILRRRGRFVRSTSSSSRYGR
jgi:hypothetical protein